MLLVGLVLPEQGGLVIFTCFQGEWFHAPDLEGLLRYRSHTIEQGILSPKGFCTHPKILSGNPRKE